MFDRLLGKRQGTSPDVGDQAPDFTVPTGAGESFTLSEALRRGPVVLAFFKITCGTCQFTFPFLERMAARYRRDPVEFWGISQDDAAKTAEFRERFSISFSTAIDAPDYAASRLYHFQFVPTILLVAPEGRVRLRISGFSKAGLIRLSEEIGVVLLRKPESVFLPGELVPETKPG